MPKICKTSPDPVKFGLDPDTDPELYGLQRTSDTESMKTKNNAFKIIENIHYKKNKKSPFIRWRYRALELQTKLGY